MHGLRERVSESVQAFRGVFGNRDLRRLQLAWAGSIIGTWSYSVAIVVFAFRAGGASGVGLVNLARWLPAAIAAPVASVLGDRYPRVRVMLSADLVRALALGAMALTVIEHWPALVVYLLAAVVATVGMAFQPAQAALVPTLARTPEELTAANVTSSTIESLGVCLGPALGGLLLAVSSTWVVFSVTMATFLLSALQLTRISAPQAAETAAARRAESFATQLLGGFQTIGRNPSLRLVVGLHSTQTLLYGATSVLIAVTALDLLGTGSSGVGFLTAAIGLGGVVGGLGASLLVGQKHLAATLGIALAGCGGPLILIGAWPNTASAFAMLAVVGASIILVDVSGYTLLQRATADEVRSRVFGVLHSLFYLTVSIGAIVAPTLVAWLGVRGALLAAGAPLPLLALVTRARLARLDAEEPAPLRQLELFEGIPIFAPLAPPTLERLASLLIPLRAAAGEVIFRQGERGDRFYIVATGEVEVEVEGSPPKTLGAGDYFGEIALLREVPRTATVRARTDVELEALEGSDFVAAVSGHAASSEAAEAVIGARLGTATI